MARATLACILLGLGACRSTPGATSLEAHEAVLTVPDLAAAELPAQELEVTPLDQEGVRGGRIAFTLDGSPSQVLEMLLDFEQASGRRIWARTYTLLSREEGVVTARWKFKGRFGINPTVVLEFRTQERPGALLVTYEILEPGFGMAAFFGDYRVFPVNGDAHRSILEERVFIDSGLTFANASAEDIQEGLREDAHALRAWIQVRSSTESYSRPRSSAKEAPRNLTHGLGTRRPGAIVCLHEASGASTP